MAKEWLIILVVHKLSRLEKLQRMRENGEDPDPSEFYLLTHTQTRDNQTIFCDDTARKVNADYVAKEKELLSQHQLQAKTNGEPVPTQLSGSKKAELFKEAAGGEKKGHVYGSGSAVPNSFL